MKRLGQIGLGLAAVLWAIQAQGLGLYRQGCEIPQPGLEICWEATGEAEAHYAPFDEEIHLLPLAVPGSGDPQIMDGYTRALYRQLLPGNLSFKGIVQEWRPAVHLEEAVRLVRANRWPLALWVSPRVMRDSGPATPGLLDLDLYFIQGKSGTLLRTIRVRVESKPEIKREERETTLGAASALSLLKTMDTTPLVGAMAVAGARSMSNPSPPEAGVSLELMTEYAFRHMMTLMQYPLESIKPPPS